MPSAVQVPIGSLWKLPFSSTRTAISLPKLDRCAYVCLLYSSPQVDKVCGLSTGEPTSMRPTSPEVTTSTGTSASPPPSVAPSKPLPEQRLGQLAHLRR